MASGFEVAHRDQLRGSLTTVDRLIIHGHLSRLWLPNHTFLSIADLPLAQRLCASFVKRRWSRLFDAHALLAKTPGRRRCRVTFADIASSLRPSITETHFPAGSRRLNISPSVGILARLIIILGVGRT